jgi:hypothetical protein
MMMMMNDREHAWHDAGWYDGRATRAQDKPMAVNLSGLQPGFHWLRGHQEGYQSYMVCRHCGNPIRETWSGHVHDTNGMKHCIIDGEISWLEAADVQQH